jgi:energy-coupling factor transporter ATP-binding protein EcfA2
MLKRYRLKNFKAFKGQHELELGRITLLYGPNSAGKSSILQSLRVLKQSYSNRSIGFPLLALTGAETDLKNYRHVVYGRKSNRNMAFGFSWRRPDRCGEKIISNDVEYRASKSSDKLRISGVGVPISYSYAFDFGNEQRRLKFDLVTRENMIDVITKRKCDADELLDRMGEEVEEVIGRRRRSRIEDDRQSEFRKRYSDYLSSEKDAKFRWGSSRDEDFYELEMIGHSVFNHGIKYAILHEKTEAMPVLFMLSSESSVNSAGYNGSKISANIESLLDTVKRYGYVKHDYGFPKRVNFCGCIGSCSDYIRDVVGKFGEISGDVDKLKSVAEKKYMRWFDKLSESMKIVNDIGSAGLECNNFEVVENDTRNMLARSIFIGPHRKRMNSPLGKNEGSEFDNSIALLAASDNLIYSVNECLKRMRIGYEFRLSKGDELIELWDTNQMLRVSFGDIGYGISQIIPIIIYSHAVVERLICIEQPELHIHPKLQAELGDILIDAASGLKQYDFDNGGWWQRLPNDELGTKQYLIETHSEALLLRLQRRIREGKLPADWLRVYYIQPGEDGSRILPLRLDEHGEFLDEWPDGFFEERLDDLLGEG